MTIEEKCLLAIEKGYTYNPLSGKIFGVKGKELTAKCNGYIIIRLTTNTNQFKLYAHQYAWYLIYKENPPFLDHINQIRNDNRLSNLRSVNHQENMFNSKAKGYWFEPANKKHRTSDRWRASICINHKVISLGSFKTEIEAKKAYILAKEKYHIIN